MDAASQPAARLQPALPVLVAAAVTALAILAALATRSGGELAIGVERASSATAGWLEGVTAVLPLGYAFGAGMVSAVNPCGFAMLPGYIGYYLGDSQTASASAPRTARLARALWISLLMSAGFVVLFGVAGIALGVASSLVVGFLPWLGLLIGLALVFVGARLLAGRTVYVGVGERVADRLGPGVRQARSRGYFTYGLAYGAASISCTLPVFLGVLGGTIAAAGITAIAAQVLLYGLGMGAVIATVTVAAALFGSSALGRARGVVRWVQPVSSALLLIAGAYIIYYWLTLGGLLP